MDITERAGTILGKIERLGFRLRGVTGPQAAVAWTDVVTLFKAHSEIWEAYESLEQIRNSILQNFAQLWILYEGDEAILVMVTKTEQAPNGLKSFMVPYLLGKGFFTEPEVTKLAMEYVETFALSGGCTVIKAITFQRIAEHLQVFGFETTRHVVEKTITAPGALN